MAVEMMRQIQAAVGRTPEGLRPGQVAFNALHTLRAEWADEIRGSGLDPFHNDDALPAFYRWLERKGGSR